MKKAFLSVTILLTSLLILTACGKTTTTTIKTINVIGEVKNINDGGVKNVSVDVNGTIKNIASWKIDSTGTVGSRYFANIPDYGMYQLSFSGTTYMADGSTESISASTTKIK